MRVVREFPRPWVLKDPRFARTLEAWLPAFDQLDAKPTLVWIRRDENAVAASFRRRGRVAGRELAHVRWLFARAQENFDRWPWTKVTIEYERIAEAVKLMDIGQAGGQD